MKAKDLAELLMNYPDFDVSFVFNDCDTTDWGMTLRQFDITKQGIDIGHSDKVISLGGEER